MESQVFSEGMELARLPFFDLRDGRLVLSDDSVGPIIDVHTHFALATLLPLRIDLQKAPGPAEHYLPMQGRAIDMEAPAMADRTPPMVTVI